LLAPVGRLTNRQVNGSKYLVAGQATSNGQEDMPLNSLQDLQNQIDYVMDMLETRL
jgi:hypothetical protein